ncbi:hypothetical protein F5X96DRAFT_631831 [Biscogniauxia mediterranea]|nr:hypothetical protein F5X96DRAFT_631831 [Biscogniauxia mediterranea]
MSSQEPSFTLFSLLPVELRLQIWRLSCHPRVVEVFYDSEDDRCTTPAHPPAILHACHESRCEALRIYKRSFGTKSHEPRIYFCHESDTLYLPRPPLMGYNDDSRSFTELVADADDIVNLAIDHVSPTIRRPWETYNKYALMQSFPRVREVFLVLHDDPEEEEDDDHHGDMDLADPAGDVLDLCRLLADVKESFSYEVGTTHSVGEKEEVVEEPKLPPLVLKAKVTPH